MLVHVSMHVTHVYLRRRAAMLDRPRDPIQTSARTFTQALIMHVGGSLAACWRHGGHAMACMTHLVMKDQFMINYKCPTALAPLAAKLSIRGIRTARRPLLPEYRARPGHVLFHSVNLIG